MNVMFLLFEAFISSGHYNLQMISAKNNLHFKEHFNALKFDFKNYFYKGPVFEI